MNKKPEIFFYIQSLLGIGHLQRAFLIAKSCDSIGFDVTLISGGVLPKSMSVPQNVKLFQLPAIALLGNKFDIMVNELGNSVDKTDWQVRLAQLKELNLRKPSLILVEMFPFGRNAFRHEILSWLNDLKETSPETKIVSSVRDILVRKRDLCKANIRELKIKNWIDRWFDLVLVHGDPKKIPFSKTYPLAQNLTEKLRYTGIVCAKAVTEAKYRKGVLVSCGGGKVGYDLLKTAIKACQLDSLGESWVLYTGPNLPAEQFKSLQQQKPRCLTLLSFTDNMPGAMAKATVSVSQAGYNTVAELLMSKTPAVLVPYSADGESEQVIRAQALEKENLAVHLKSDNLGPEVLLAAIIKAKGLAPLSSEPWQLNGADKTASCLQALL